MAQQLTEVGLGLSLDGEVSILYGTGAPGGTNETDTAKKGSSYSDVTTGAKWQKIADSTGSAAWVELAGKDAAIMVEHIASTGVILDQVPVKLANEFAWMVTAFNEADPSNKYSALIHMSHNGTEGTDATKVVFDQSSILRQGAKISGLTISATLTGAGADQFMNLHVSSGAMVTFIAYRMVKNVAGSNTVVLGGANLDNHVADGSVHLQAWQNTLLDSLSQSLTATQVNALLGVTGNVQTQLDGKAAASDVATALSGKADVAALAAKANTASLAMVATSGDYNDLSNKPVFSAPVTSVAGKTGVVTLTAADLTAYTGLPYDLAFPVYDIPLASEVVFRMRACRAFIISNSQSNGQAKATTAATASTTFVIAKNGSQVGTITFPLNGTTGTISIVSNVSVVVGDLVTVTAPASADATIANIDFALIANLA